MAVYHAIKPTKTPFQWVKTIGLRLIFPPILLWDGLKILTNALFGRAIGRIVLPAQKINFSASQRKEDEFYEGELKCVRHLVKTYDGCKLDTLEIKHPSQIEKELKDQHYILNFMANNASYEEKQHMEEMLEDARALQCNVVGFNYRGVSKSGHERKSVQSFDELVVDGIAQAERILNKKEDGGGAVLPKHLTFKGRSLGAAVAAQVAKYFHERQEEVSIFSDRSCSNETKMVVGNKIRRENSFFRKFLGTLSYPFIKLSLVLSKWAIPAAYAYQALPANQKEYIVVKKQDPRYVRIKQDDANKTEAYLHHKNDKGKGPEFHRHRANHVKFAVNNHERCGDMSIPSYASLHQAMHSQHKKQKQALGRVYHDLLDARQDPLVLTELDKASSHLSKARRNQKMREMRQDDEHAKQNAHDLPLKYLLTPNKKINAATFFWNFVRRAQGLSSSAQPEIKPESSSFPCARH